MDPRVHHRTECGQPMMESRRFYTQLNVSHPKQYRVEGRIRKGSLSDTMKSSCTS